MKMPLQALSLLNEDRKRERREVEPPLQVDYFLRLKNKKNEH